MRKAGIKGLWHAALRVTDLPRSEAFYAGLFGMTVVWRPDADSVYLSSGADNLALHQIPPSDRGRFQDGSGQFLDHLGVIVDTPEAVRHLLEEARRLGVPVLKEPRQHRDGSYSCYLSDPDGNVVQVLYEPTISRLTVRSET